MTKQSILPMVYMMANRKNGAIYTGVTSDLVKRAYEHKQGIQSGFTARYNCKLLVYFEAHETMESAITREKQIKSGSRNDKIKIIQNNNPEWKDLYESIFM